MDNSLYEIPNSWKWVTLEDIGIVVSGGTPSTKEPEFWNGDVPWITPADLSNHNDIFISKGSRNISEIGLNNSSAYLLPKNSVVFSSRAPIGYVAVTKNELATSQGFKNLILPSDTINPKYVYFYLKTKKELAESMASGTTFLELSAIKFKQIPFPLAPFEEQNLIVKKIEEVFSEVESLENTLSHELKRLTFLKEITIKKIFTFEETKKTQPLSNVMILKSGAFLSSKIRNNAGKYAVYGGNGILGYHNEYIYDEPKLVIGRVGEYCGNTHITYEKSWITDNALVVDFKKNENIYFFKYYLSHLNLRSLAKSSSQPVISANSIYNLKIHIPSLEDQVKIVNIYESEISKIDNLIENVSKEKQKTEILKSKILEDAYQGKLTNQLEVYISVENLLENIKKEKDEYLLKQKEIKSRPKVKKMEKEKLSIIQVLEKKREPLSPKQLWQDSMYSDNIEVFYSELKKIQDSIIEKKTDKGSLISLK